MRPFSQRAQLIRPAVSFAVLRIVISTVVPVMLAAGECSGSCVAAPSGIVSWWPGEGNANDVIDGNPGISLNGTAFAPGKVGQAFKVNGINNYVMVADAPNLRFTKAMTVEVWVNPSFFGSHPREILSKWEGGSDQRAYTLSIAADPAHLGQVYFLVSADGGYINQTVVYTSTAIPANQWSYLAGTYDGTSLKLYLNGVLSGSVPWTSGIFPGTSALTIGSTLYSGSYFGGLIDEPTLYNRALTAAEIQGIFNAGSAGKCATTTNQPPIAQCKNVVVAAGSNCLAGASVDNGSFDPDGDPIVVTQSPLGPYPLGTNQVQLTVTDTHGASNSCTALVIVVDQTPPSIVCPSNIILPNDLNQCGAVVTYPLPTATDSCSMVRNVTGNPASGSFFAVGTNSITVRATDAAGNSTQCVFTVTVLDVQPPVILCPQDITVTNAHDAWTSVVAFNPTALDNCPGVAPVTCNPPSGSIFALGTHLVTAVTMDAAGNGSQCSFHVTVLPGNRPPVPIIEVSPLLHFPGWTNLIVLAPNNNKAEVVFDGSKSYDPDGDLFKSFWLEGTNLFSTNLVSTNVLALGTHDVTLVLDDTFPLGTNSATVSVEVISPCEAIAMVVGMVDDSKLSTRSRQPLLVSLAAACASFERGDTISGVNQLQAFLNKVRAQVAPLDPALATQLTQAAKAIVGAMRGK